MSQTPGAQRPRKPDSDLVHDVARELAWDTRVSPTEVGIQVKNGVVTFTGTVDTWAQLRAAQEAAHRVVGVLDVANDLTVKPAGSSIRTDTEIAQAVRAALEGDVTVPDERVRSTVSHGSITLEGEVAHWNQRLAAEHAIERLAGVKQVVNRIKVKPTEELNLEHARQAIEIALERTAEREAARIQLQVAGGTVNVTGVVHSLHEKETVLGAVRGTRGVGDVADHLRIEPHR